MNHSLIKLYEEIENPTPVSDEFVYMFNASLGDFAAKDDAGLIKLAEMLVSENVQATKILEVKRVAEDRITVRYDMFGDGSEVDTVNLFIRKIKIIK